MAQYEMSLRDYQRIILKRKRGIVVFILLAGVGTFFVARTPDVKYEATSKIRVARPSDPSRLVQVFLAINEANDIATHRVRVTGQTTLVAVAHALGMLPEVEQSMKVEEVIAKRASASPVAGVAEGLRNRLKVEQEVNTNILSITAVAGDPASAQKLADSVAVVYRDRTNDQNNQQGESKLRYLQGEFKRAQDALEVAQQELQDKRQLYMGKGFSKGGHGSLIAERGTAEYDLKAVRQQIEQMERWSAADEDAVIQFTAGQSGNAVIDHLSQQLVDLQLRARQLLVYHTREAPQVKDLQAQMAGIVKGILQELRSIEAGLQSRIELISKSLKESPKAEMELSQAEGQVEALKAVRDQLATAKREAEIGQQERRITVWVEEHASVATKVKQAGKTVLVVVGCIVGLIFGFLYAVVMEVLDTSIDTIDDVEEFLGTHVRGVIPHIDMGEVKAMMREANPDLSDEQLPERPVLLTTQLGPKSACAEAFRTLRTNLEFEITRRDGNAITVASAALGEGKTSCSCNLAIAFAQNGKRTVLVDGDLRRPAVFKAFGLDKQPGLAEVLQDRVSLDEAVRTVSDVFLGTMSTDNVFRMPGLENLHIITCGGTPSNPSELLSQEQMKRVVKDLKQSYDVVLIDSPPVLPVADAVILGSLVDGVLLVYQVGKVGRGVLKRAKTQLDQVGADVWGVVLNDLTPEVSEFKDDASYYRQYYYKEEPGKRGGWWPFGGSGGS